MCDEAYGYVYGVDGTKFWSSYIDQVNADADFNTIKQTLIRSGRAAIVANEYEKRDEQANIIKAKLALVPAVRLSLQEGKGKLTTDKKEGFSCSFRSL
jgi:hypothetical protein